MKYRIFRRTWWKENPSYPNGLEPEPGPRHYVRGAVFDDEDKCRKECQRLNREAKSSLTAEQRRLSLKYEFESF